MGFLSPFGEGGAVLGESGGVESGEVGVEVREWGGRGWGGGGKRVNFNVPNFFGKLPRHVFY